MALIDATKDNYINVKKEMFFYIQPAIQTLYQCEDIEFLSGTDKEEKPKFYVKL